MQVRLVSAPLKIFIIGVGSPLMSDDGAGVEVVEALEGRALGEGVRVIDGGTGGPALVSYFEEADVVILADAADFGAPPGAVRVFEPGQIDLEAAEVCISLHEADVAGALALGRAMGVKLAPYYLVAVQPLRVESGIGLSEPVSKAIGEMAERIIALVEKLKKP